MKKSPQKKQLPTLSREEITALVGGTWFDLHDEDDKFVLDTRQNGDVGSETPGKADIAEARRMALELKRQFPRHEVRCEAIDEWVLLEVSKAEKSREKLEREEREERSRKLSQEWKPRVEEALQSATAKCLGENTSAKNYAVPFSWTGSLSVHGKSATTKFSSKYGERYLYRDHLGAIPVFLTPQESRKHFSDFIGQLGGKVTGESMTDPTPSLTYNYSPPNNVIEKVGYIYYQVELPASPPRRLSKSLQKAQSNPLIAGSPAARSPSRSR